jgi:acyl-CoA synthetase (AMP-forming)/AMP-acid ligase II
MNHLADMIRRAGLYYADKIAVVCEERQVTFAEINVRSNRLARALIKAGVKKGDRVGVLLPNCAEFIESDFALIKGAFVRLPINPRLKPSEYAYMLNDAQAGTLIFGSQYADDVDKLRAELNTVVNFIQVGGTESEFATLFEAMIAQADDGDVSVDVAQKDPYQILYTSGTTGKPKGAVTSFRSRLSTLATVLIEEMKVKPDDALLSVAPLAHGGGTKILPHFVRGAKNVLLPKFTLETFCQTIETEKITTTWMVPTMITMLLEFPDLKKYDLSSLQTVVYAAAPMPEATLRRALETFGNIFVQVYGLSEAPNPVLLLSREDHIVEGTTEQVRRLQSAGREVFGVFVRVVNSDGESIKPGEIGEIIIAGDNIMTEYWKLPEATDQTIRDGWLYTGDMATVDDAGYVFIVDRRKDLIISGGFNVYPREIEEEIYKHPAVLEAAVIGVPDERWGESVKAVVSCKPGAKVTEDELIAFIENRISGYKKPKSVDFMESLPKGANGKILKRELKDKFWAGCRRMVN